MLVSHQTSICRILRVAPAPIEGTVVLLLRTACMSAAAARPSRSRLGWGLCAAVRCCSLGKSCRRRPSGLVVSRRCGSLPSGRTPSVPARALDSQASGSASSDRDKLVDPRASHAALHIPQLTSGSCLAPKWMIRQQNVPPTSVRCVAFQLDRQRAASSQKRPVVEPPSRVRDPFRNLVWPHENQGTKRRPPPPRSPPSCAAESHSCLVWVGCGGHSVNMKDVLDCSCCARCHGTT